MDRNFTARGHHDMGGLDAGEIDRDEHDYALWEKRVDAMMMLLTNKLQIMTVDQLRKGIEGLPPDAYERMSYYERWIASVANTLLDAGVISADELGARMAAIEARGLGAAGSESESKSGSELNQGEAG
ncbi:MAG: nitrile hydratase subunit beta [Proteobacteria bacterium]|nr:nitrile hydratase subunit beta [Pseudomonadota bacterium]